MTDVDLFVKHSMQTLGHVPPTIFIHGENGKAMFGPQKLPDDRSKDEFVALSRVMCIAHKADATVLVTEAWMKSAKKGEKLDLKKQPSQYADREEVVIMLGETRAGCQQRILPMLRADKGKFVGFGEERKIDAEKIKGRFANFIPRIAPDEQNRTMAKLVLKKLGIDIEREQAKDRGLARF